MSTFEYTPVYQHHGIETPWRHITSEGVHRNLQRKRDAHPQTRNP